MIVFDQLRIADNGNTLYIDAHVNTHDNYYGVYIESITITTADKVSKINPIEPDTDYIYYKNFDERPKAISLALTANDFMKSWGIDPKSINFNSSEMAKTLFFVYIKCVGEPTISTPCGQDNQTSVGIVFNESMLHQKAMGFTKDLVNKNNIAPFIDFILLWNAFKAGIETEHYVSAIKFWEMLFDSCSQSSYYNTKNCNCYG